MTIDVERLHGDVYPSPPPEIDRTVTWRSVIAGYILIAGIFAIMVAISYPQVTAGVIATGAGIYALYWIIQNTTPETRYCIPRTQVCFQISHRSK